MEVKEVAVEAKRRGESVLIVEDLKVLGLKEEEAQNRLRWRRGIRGDRLTCASMD